MFFSKLELHNYGIYRGSHEMCLRDGLGPHNITLIGGLNGRGKTTFHDAILLALYGKQAYRYIQEKARSLDSFLSERINSNAVDDKTYVAVSMVLEDKSTIRIQRTWERKSNHITLNVSVEKDGQNDQVLADNWDYYVEEILPFGIARFFLFNNEKLTQLADDVSFEQIKESIKSAIGVSTIEKTIDHLNAVIRRKEEAVISFQNSALKQDYQQAKEEAGKLEIQKNEADHRSQELLKNITVISAKIETEEKKFWASGGRLGIDQDSILAEKQRLSEERAVTRSNILRLASEPTAPLYLCRELLQQAYNSENVLQSSQNAHYFEQGLTQLCQRIVERLLAEGFSSEALDLVVSIVRDEADRISPDGTPTRTPLPPATMALFDQVLSVTLQMFPLQARDLLYNAQAQENKLVSLDAHLDESNDKALAVKLFEALSGLEEEKAQMVDEYEKQIRFFQSVSRQYELACRRRDSLLAELAGQENDNNDNARILRYAVMSIEILRQFKVHMQQQKLTNLSEVTTRCFLTLTEKASLVKHIYIDSETLDISMQKEDGSELKKSQLSAGEQQMFAISIVWALALTSGYKAPVVIDTPMARLDSAHRTSFVKEYLPAASSQVIVLSTDEEIAGNYLDLVRGNVLDSYTLLYHEDGQYTSVVPGYFGEAL